MAWEENLDVFFSDLDVVEAVFTLEGGVESTIRGYFDNAYFDTQAGETILDTTQPRFTCKREDIEGIERGDTAVINGDNYSVLSVQPDPTGTAIIVLTNE